MGNVPWWIAIRKKDLAVIPHPEYFDTAKQVIKLIQQGNGIKKVCAWLKEKHSEKTWGHSTIAGFAKQKALYGERTVSIQGTDYVMDNYYPALVDKSTYYALQKVKRKAAPSRNTTLVSLLTGIGITRCIQCGSPVSQQIDYSHGKPTIRLFCSDRTKKITGCLGWSLKAAYPERVLFNECKSLVFTDTVKDTSTLDSLLAQKEEQQKNITDIQNAIASDPRLVVTLAPAMTSTLDVIDQLNIDIDAEQKALAALTTESYSMELFDEWNQQSDAALVESDTDLRSSVKDLIQSIFSKIEIGKLGDRFTFVYTAVTGNMAAAVMTGTQRNQQYLPLAMVSNEDLEGIKQHQPEIAHLFTTRDLLRQHVAELDLEKQTYGQKPI
ncbi:recombinase family protein [Shewanella sp. MBTL60-007]|uniref:recombinase family protein n=1 Tax=Shewanella sp. MBTL60-007 TaxID=2815911 RepID=UPI00217FB4F7|nr:recombinase family protein [Shewanella sp. MBTL60-007]